ncbi:MAG: DUF370 domain-containing protein [Clostridiales bacterium]|nr:DUF370 domain-containing protein [Clostridiales bacterium]
MFIHIGKNVVIKEESIIAIIDVKTVNKSKYTKQLIKIADENGILRNAMDDEPKSYILAEVDKKDVLYISSISSATLCRRIGFTSTLQTEGDLND